ncbi:TetR family transcriptional regulator [Microbacterium sp. Leaf288]|uniref:TetR/AcrR family transcriptional regulator n=1 Tax=Microbacterium sp. Leaf288 TaxID=1736323 RepID=UPI0006F5A18B|nr:TetR/AcrR family transcriptional regulator [Microbacterium sp. Leaf288]KQP70768.1 TetR family transcriptional regulator [Microbacterium sp. Leaf288]
MSTVSPALGRRERNKQDKLDRIVRAASTLFASHGIDEVTTQQIAEAADIGAGTLFLYAKSKSELLLMVQNAHYATALERGRQAAASTDGVVDGIIAQMEPIVACNRVHVDNGRIYLREILFGDASEPHHAEALEIVEQNEQDIAGILVARAGATQTDALVLARVISSALLVTMAAADRAWSVAEVMTAVRTQIAAIMR